MAEQLYFINLNGEIDQILSAVGENIVATTPHVFSNQSLGSFSTV